MLSPLKSQLVLENQFGEVSINYLVGANGPLTVLDLSANPTLSADLPVRTQASGAKIIIDATFGSDVFTDPSSAFGLRGYVQGANLAQLYSTLAGVVGVYSVTGTNASVLPKCGLLGIVGDTTTTADAAIMAYMDGDGGSTTARAGYGIMMLNSTGSSKFSYGMDLQLQVVSGHESFSRAYGVADLRLNSGVVFYSGAGVPSLSAPQGSMYLRTDGSGGDQVLYVNTAVGSNWIAAKLTT